MFRKTIEKINRYNHFKSPQESACDTIGYFPEINRHSLHICVLYALLLQVCCNIVYDTMSDTASKRVTIRNGTRYVFILKLEFSYFCSKQDE